jgi:hypothetical protein
MRRVAYPIRLAPLIVIFLAGCAGMGGTNKTRPPKTLSHVQFIRAADRVCTRFRRQAKGLAKKPASLAAEERQAELALATYERVIFDLRGLTPPPSDAGAFQRLLATLDAEDLVAHKLGDSIDAGQVRQERTFTSQFSVLRARLQSLAVKLGLRTCFKRKTRGRS